MGFLSKFKSDLEQAKKEKAAQINGKHLKKLLKKFKEERDRIEKETGIRPQIDQTTRTLKHTQEMIRLKIHIKIQILEFPGLLDGNK